MTATLYLVRHGQTLFNVRHKIQGWCDAPLTPLGIHQAQLAGAYFKDHQITFDHAYSSTAERASDTLELITTMPYRREKGLKEWNFGTIEGESEDLNPPLPYGDFFKTYYHGEGEMEVRERMAKTLGEIMARPDHHCVLAVSHGAACRGFMRYWAATQQVDQQSRLRNGGILKFTYGQGTFTLVAIINPKDQDITLK